MADSIRSEKTAPRESLPHRLACWTAAGTLLLLLVGALVTTHRAGLAVPDWPTTFGYNMFFFPWSKMVGGVFYEHSHRLVASGVGLLTIAMALALWWFERRVWLRGLGTVALALVIVQGIVGGLRVVLLEETLAIIHACLAQAFFALVVGLAFLTSAEWAGNSQRVQLPDAPRIRRLSFVTTALVYMQAILGAVLRHTGAGLEAHLFLAFLVALHAILLGRQVIRSAFVPDGFRRSGIALLALVGVQLALGLGAYWVRFGAVAAPWATIFFTTAHVVTGAALLGASVAITLRSYRFLTFPAMVVDDSGLAKDVCA